MSQELLENGKKIVNLVRSRWEQGKRPDGSDIGEYKNFSYEMMKRQMNPKAGGKVDLMLEGDLESGLELNYLRGSFFNIFSSDKKAVSITERYGLEVFGLSVDELKMVLMEAKNNVFIKLYQFALL